MGRTALAYVIELKPHLTSYPYKAVILVQLLIDHGANIDLQDKVCN